MLVLTADTSTPAVTAGLVRLDEGAAATVAVRVTRDARAHAEVLTPQILECLQDAGAAPADLDAVVVGAGPGPFTGLRVGMATAAAFGDALGIPVQGCAASTPSPRRPAPTRGGGRGASGGVPGGHRRAAARGVLGAVPGPRAGRGSGRRRTGRRRRRRRGRRSRVAGSHCDGGAAGVHPRFAHAVGLVAAAADLLAAGTEPAPLEPLYLRRPDAAEPTPRVPAAQVRA
ncbi:tRNA (adenosine(37)-N6)-threonylcarbamoyltransferase complex dimerization subunit type 1 TsaB [Tomitella gaofuii]|uniref:tRNA (adenosine(37)-N6)-threonylcarbamoyltransferase complex dimerization subunit type 1 TsaB n=1 Tax=Tomitella gaofuii TaxID=2760083 RepID=UPI001F399C05|nr:tRNA (adenosine(37)-N6)-threonylcarbamoyltransferase complex dimerization subunit type 1 TsaB [Tomitella gaofuii]